MRNKAEDPKNRPTEDYIVRDEKDRVLRIRERHPSYGTIAMHHVQGSAPLFDSDVLNQHFVQITVQEASKFIDGDREWVMGDTRPLVEIRMSAAQFAEFITSPNRGTGASCTIVHAQGDPVYDTRFGSRPAPPTPQPFTERFKQEARERTRLMAEHMDAAKVMVDELLTNVTKPTKANLGTLKSELEAALREIQSNLPYVMESLEETTEKRMQHAVTEFESYVSTRLQRAGLEYLQGQAPRLRAPETKALTNGDNSDTASGHRAKTEATGTDGTTS
jgi:ElaB/YqjD/DUF883 family membrane-anchored ribosome-binding protein